jgi:hypothetical protein
VYPTLHLYNMSTQHSTYLSAWSNSAPAAASSSVGDSSPASPPALAPGRLGRDQLVDFQLGVRAGDASTSNFTLQGIHAYKGDHA